MVDASQIRNKKISLKNLSSFYGTMASLYAAGFTLENIFVSFFKNETDETRKHQFKIIVNKLRLGQKFSETLDQVPIIPDFDIPLFKAAEKMGRVPELAKTLAARSEETYNALEKIKGQMIHPLFTLLLAIAIQDFALLVSSKITVTGYVLGMVPELGLFFGGIWFFFWAWEKSQYSKAFRRSFYGFFGLIPGINRFIFSIALQRFSLAFELALETGVDMYDSLYMAGESAGLEKLRIATNRIVPMIKEGLNLEDALKVENVFPREFVLAVQLGLTGGTMPEAIRQYRRVLEIEIEKQRSLLVKFVPTVIQILVGLFVASTLLDFYKNAADSVQIDE